MSRRQITIKLAAAVHTVELTEWDRAREDAPGRLKVLIDDEERTISYRVLGPDRLRLLMADRAREVRLAREGHVTHLSVDGFSVAARRLARRRGGEAAELPPVVTPPTPAVVVQLLVEPDQAVTRGQGVVVVSAMKLETTLQAPHDGTVTAIQCREGDQVMPGDELVVITPGEPEEETGEKNG